MSKIKKLLSLFSGCGGMDIGFEGGFSCLKKSINHKIHKDWIVKENKDFVNLTKTNFEIVFANDIRQDAKNAWCSYFSKKGQEVERIYHTQSIVDIVKSVKNGNYSFPKKIDIVTGGFPCQDFSVAGKRLGFNSKKNHLGEHIAEKATIENRGQLYMFMKDVVTITEPKVFIAENVKGLANLSNVKDIIMRDFKNSAGGYLVVAKILNSANYGVPQNRERIIFIGFLKSALTFEAKKALSKYTIDDQFDPYPQITHSNIDITLPNFVTCRDAFIDLEEPDLSKDLSQQKYSKAKFMGKHCQGQTEIKLDDVAPTIRSEHHGNIEFRRLLEEHGGKYLDELKQGKLERRLSVRECARLQTFPDDYDFILPNRVSASSAYKIIGNAVPCVMAYNIAKNLEKKWELYFGK